MTLVGKKTNHKMSHNQLLKFFNMKQVFLTPHYIKNITKTNVYFLVAQPEEQNQFKQKPIISKTKLISKIRIMNKFWKRGQLKINFVFLPIF